MSARRRALNRPLRPARSVRRHSLPKDLHEDGRRAILSRQVILGYPPAQRPLRGHGILDVDHPRFKEVQQITSYRVQRGDSLVLILSLTNQRR